MANQVLMRSYFIGIVCIIFLYNSSTAQKLDFKSISTLEGNEEQSSTSSLLDVDGNIYIKGFFSKDLIIKNSTKYDTLSAQPNANAYIVKYNKNEELIWKKAIRSGGEDIVTIGKNIYASVFAFTPLNEVKYVLLETLQGDSIYEVENIDILEKDKHNNLLATGYFDAKKDFNPAADSFMLTTYKSIDIYFAKYSEERKLLWAKNIKGSSAESGTYITSDNKGNVILAATFSDSLDVDDTKPGFEMIANNYRASCLNKYDANGNIIWYRQLFGDDQIRVNKIAVGKQNEIYITGSFSGTIEFNIDGKLEKAMSQGNGDVFVAKLSESGDFLWYNTYGSVGEDYGLGLTLDKEDNVLITGAFIKDCDFNTGNNINLITSTGGYNGYIQILDQYGFWINAFPIHSTLNAFTDNILLNEKNELYCIGTYAKNVDADLSNQEQIFSSTSFYCSFIAKYNYTPTKAYIPMELATDWRYRLIEFGGPVYLNWTYIKDSVIDNRTYRLIGVPNVSTESSQFWIREDKTQRIVYQWKPSTNNEVVLFDFNLKVGETFIMPKFAEPFTVTSIDTINSLVGPLLKWNLAKVGRSLSFTEMVGGNDFIFSNVLQIPDPFIILTCVHRQCEKIYGDFSCPPPLHRTIWNTTNVDICYGEIYDGHVTSGIYTKSFIDSMGCENINVLDLNVSEMPLTEEKTISLCRGDTVIINEEAISNAGIYTYNTFTQNNCLEKININNVIVHEIQEMSIDTSICEGSQYLGLSQSGNYQIDTIDLITGCPIKYFINLTVLPMTDPTCISATIDGSNATYTISPNPASNKLTVSTSKFVIGSNTHFLVYDLTGLNRINYEIKESPIEIPITNLNAGMYLYFIKINGHILGNGKLVVE